MTARNKLLTAPPYAVERTLKGLGANLRTARLRRNLTIGEMAEKIGTGERAVGRGEVADEAALKLLRLDALGLRRDDVLLWILCSHDGWPVSWPSINSWSIE